MAAATTTTTNWTTILDPEEEAKVAAEYPTLEHFYGKTKRDIQMHNSDKYYVIYRIWSTAWQMLEDRGYEINVDEYDIPFDVFKDKFFKEGKLTRYQREKLEIRVDRPSKVIVAFLGSHRLERLPTLPVTEAELMNENGDIESYHIIGLLSMRSLTEESSKKSMEDFYRVTYPHLCVTTEIFAYHELFYNKARFDMGMRRYKKVTAEEEEELIKFIKGLRNSLIKEEDESSEMPRKRLKNINPRQGKRNFHIKEEENSKGARGRLKDINPRQGKRNFHIKEESSKGARERLIDINPLQIAPLDEESGVVRYFALKKGEFIKSSRPRHVNAALKAKLDAAEAKDPKGFRESESIKRSYFYYDEFQVIYHYRV